MRTGDFNPLVSSQVQDRTQILYRRDASERINAIAPFLELDSPCIVVLNGRLLRRPSPSCAGSCGCWLRVPAARRDSCLRRCSHPRSRCRRAIPSQDALKQGDLATYAREIGEMGRLLQQADAIDKGSPAVSPSPGASPTTLPRASPTVSSRASP
jgi:hypothetical protein